MKLPHDYSESLLVHFRRIESLKEAAQDVLLYLVEKGYVK